MLTYIGMNYKLHEPLTWTRTIAYFLRFFSDKQKEKTKHLILDARFSTKTLYDYINELGFRASVAFKANVEQQLWITLGEDLKPNQWRAAILPCGSIASCYATGTNSQHNPPIVHT